MKIITLKSNLFPKRPYNNVKVVHLLVHTNPTRKTNLVYTMYKDVLRSKMVDTVICLFSRLPTIYKLCFLLSIL